jgi:hypothetical protein
VKLIVVLLVLVIFAGPTVAKRFSPQPEPPARRGVVFRTVRRFGLIRVLLVAALVVVLAPTAFWLLIR